MKSKCTSTNELLYSFYKSANYDVANFLDLTKTNRLCVLVQYLYCKDREWNILMEAKSMEYIIFNRI